MSWWPYIVCLIVAVQTDSVRGVMSPVRWFELSWSNGFCQQCQGASNDFLDRLNDPLQLYRVLKEVFSGVCLHCIPRVITGITHKNKKAPGTCVDFQPYVATLGLPDKWLDEVCTVSGAYAYQELLVQWTASHWLYHTSKHLGAGGVGTGRTSCVVISA